MLKHEHEEEGQSAPVLPAGRCRVTPEELNAALSALESSKQEQARQIEQTVAIGDVVQELGLNVTAEEVWQQVQAQRAQTPAVETSRADALHETLHAAAQRAGQAAGQAAAVAQAAASEAMAHAEARRARPGFQQGRGRGMFAACIALICIGTAVISSDHGLVVNGDHETATYSGAHKVAVVNGSNETITLRGDCGSLVVSGDHDTIKVLGSVGHVVVFGDGDAVIWTREPSGHTTSIMDNGDGNKIAPAAPISAPSIRP